MTERQKKPGTRSYAAAAVLIALLSARAAGLEVRTSLLDDGKYAPVPVPETVMILQKGGGAYTIKSAEDNGFTCKALAMLEASGQPEADEMPFIFELKAEAAGMGANAIELDATDRAPGGGVSGVSAKAWRVEWKGRAANFSGNFKDDALVMNRLEDLGKVLSPGTTLDQKRVYISSQIAGFVGSMRTLFDMADIQMSTAVASTPGFMVLTEEDRRKICKAVGADDPACTAKAGKPDGKKGYLESLGLSAKNIKELYRSAVKLAKEYPAQFRQLKDIYTKTYKNPPIFDPASPEKQPESTGTAESTATAKDQQPAAP